jgi:RNA polymerase sigma-70 factor (ECF subfamily)
MSIVSNIEDRTPQRADAHLARLLVRSACGEVAAFMEFYDATCTLVWRLETARDRDAVGAAQALHARYQAAWLKAGSQGRSGLTPRTWLLSLSVAPVPPGVLGRTAGERR